MKNVIVNLLPRYFSTVNLYLMTPSPFSTTTLYTSGTAAFYSDFKVVPLESLISTLKNGFDENVDTYDTNHF